MFTFPCGAGPLDETNRRGGENAATFTGKHDERDIDERTVRSRER